jgi:hypothetical protein
MSFTVCISGGDQVACMPTHGCRHRVKGYNDAESLHHTHHHKSFLIQELVFVH